MSRILASIVAVLIFCSLPAGLCAQGVLGSFWPGLETVARPLGNLKLDVAYFNYTNPVLLGFEVESTTLITPLPSWAVKYSLRGLQLGASTTAAVGDSFGVSVGGTWLVADNRAADERRGEFFMLEETRQWTTTRTQWYTLDAYAFWPFFGPFRGLAGFRYDA